MHNVFISYHHGNDQYYKNYLLEINKLHNIFLDGSVDTGDIDEELSDIRIREIIRDEYLATTTVTIVLIGTETKKRKHVDWEIYSSMFDGVKNKKSGILVVNLPTINCTNFTAVHEKEKEVMYPHVTEWTSITDRTEYERRYPYMTDRLIDNLIKKEAKISVVNWNTFISDVNKMKFIIYATFNGKGTCVYDLSRPMKRANS
jgi:hypothetical protein